MNQISGNSPSTLEELYSGNDIDALFPGGFINFGYYDGIDTKNIDVRSRVVSQKKLYDKVFRSLKLQDGDSVLEVGIGYGGGPAWTAESFKLKKMVGIDIFDSHIKLAERNFKNHLEKYPYLSYKQAVAENIPFENASFSKIYTIEAFQHFIDQKKFISESFRLLKKSGTLVISTFFLTGINFLTALEKQLPKIAILPGIINAQNVVMTANQLKDELMNIGFDEVNIVSIGENVWAGYNNWVAQTENNWDLAWFDAYESKMLDYYVIQATKK